MSIYIHLKIKYKLVQSSERNTERKSKQPPHPPRSPLKLRGAWCQGGGSAELCSTDRFSLQQARALFGYTGLAHRQLNNRWEKTFIMLHRTELQTIQKAVKSLTPSNPGRPPRPAHSQARPGPVEAMVTAAAHVSSRHRSRREQQQPPPPPPPEARF